ncbi:uncharacterized protein DUF3592 [Roseimicrobium gellanilyticum]|uniref:Uncharacterized protein DUF3592 n=1 Tax=Roseimicrobium gellanilyticum TaxID=748857 RepID=A0A366HMC4_9BACT|nr:DUF3592 domain-containing protein [Roseimicrobium gellanilyticum]RBP44287.1 uncharacterized protein DUF3592 [Roseimicrobium gellanilyticum]
MPPLIQWVLVIFGLWMIYLNVQGLLAKKKNLALATAAVNWPSVIGTVVSSNIVEGRSTDSKTGQTYHSYSPKVEYSYTVAGAGLQGTRIAFGRILYYQPTEAEAFLTKHAPGASISVWHDPAAPAEAVLDRDPAHATHLVVADFAMLGFGLLAAGAGVWSMLVG